MILRNNSVNSLMDNLKDKLYNDYSSYIKENYNQRVQKISIDAGFTCPNRDGSISTGGCIYCHNDSFSPFHTHKRQSITEQINVGIRSFSEKYNAQKYWAYFQSYTNTYSNLSVLKERYNEALCHHLITGLVIATRPDCISNEVLEYFKELNNNTELTIELGVESCNNEVLNLINRGHSFEKSVEAINQLSASNIKCGIHLIFGLPTETRETILQSAKILSKLKIHTLKIHHLQIIEGTKMSELYKNQSYKFDIYHNPHEYIDLVIDFIEMLNPSIIVERFVSESPKNIVVEPCWYIKNFQFVEKVRKRMRQRQTWQGKYFNP